MHLITQLINSRNTQQDKKLIVAEPDVYVFDLNDLEPQFLILASDGLWDCFSNDDAVNYVKDQLATMKKKSNIKQELLAYELAKLLSHEAYRRFSVDNISVVIVLFDEKDFNKKNYGFQPSMSTANRRRSSAIPRAVN